MLKASLDSNKNKNMIVDEKSDFEESHRFSSGSSVIVVPGKHHTNMIESSNNNAIDTKRQRYQH